LKCSTSCRSERKENPSSRRPPSQRRRE
jgi:hypothetical protein